MAWSPGFAAVGGAGTGTDGTSLIASRGLRRVPLSRRRTCPELAPCRHRAGRLSWLQRAGPSATLDKRSSVVRRCYGRSGRTRQGERSGQRPRLRRKRWSRTPGARKIARDDEPDREFTQARRREVLAVHPGPLQSKKPETSSSMDAAYGPASVRVNPARVPEVATFSPPCRNLDGRTVYTRGQRDCGSRLLRRPSGPASRAAGRLVT